VPLRHVLWPIQQQLGALKRIGSRFPFRLVAFRRILACRPPSRWRNPGIENLHNHLPFLIWLVTDNFLALE